MPRVSGYVASYRGTIFARGWGHDLHLEGGWAQPDYMVQISVLAHRFIGEDQKKGLRREISVFLMTFTRIFVLQRKFTHACWEQVALWGAQAPNCTSVPPALLLCFGAQSSLGGHKQ